MFFLWEKGNSHFLHTGNQKLQRFQFQAQFKLSKAFSDHLPDQGCYNPGAHAQNRGCITQGWAWPEALAPTEPSWRLRLLTQAAWSHLQYAEPGYALLGGKTTGACFRICKYSSPFTSLEVMIMVLLAGVSLTSSPHCLCISQNRNNKNSNWHLPTANYMPGTLLSPFYVCI